MNGFQEFTALVLVRGLIAASSLRMFPYLMVYATITRSSDVECTCSDVCVYHQILKVLGGQKTWSRCLLPFSSKATKEQISVQYRLASLTTKAEASSSPDSTKIHTHGTSQDLLYALPHNPAPTIDPALASSPPLPLGFYSFGGSATDVPASRCPCSSWQKMVFTRAVSTISKSSSLRSCRITLCYLGTRSSRTDHMSITQEMTWMATNTAGTRYNDNDMPA